MAAELVLLDAAGNELSLDGTNPVDFGSVTAGGTSEEVEAKVRNVGDQPAYFVTVRGIQHPTAQVGSEAATFAATEVAATRGGAFAETLDVGTLEPDEEATFYLRWVVPSSAPAGELVWAIDATGTAT